MKDDLFYLPVKIGNVELRNPFIVSAGPTVKRVDQMELAEKCGWGAASIPLVEKGEASHLHSGIPFRL